MQNFMAMMKPGTDQPDDGTPWWMKSLGKGTGILGGGGKITNFLNFIKFWNPVSDFFVLKMSNTSLSL
jgi:hypothetical protein